LHRSVYVTLVTPNIYLNRFDSPVALAKEAQSNQLDSPPLRFLIYQLNFLQNIPAGMSDQVAWSTGKPGVEDVFLAFEADTASYSGRLAKARELDYALDRH
jgi:hypothetical protein